MLPDGIGSRLISIRVLLSVIFGLLFFSAPVQAQSFQLGIDFSAVNPKGDFRQINGNGYGVGGQFAVALGRKPIFVGVDGGIVTYGSVSRREFLSGTIPDIEVDVDTDNNILLTHFLIRVQPRTGRVRPYADGLIGFKYLFTQTTVTADNDDDPLATTTNFSDFAFSYGIGSGVQIRLASLGGSREIALDGKARYLWGSNAQYLREGSLSRDDNQVIFEVLSSRTNAFAAQVGVTFRF
jgi:hypothetical protein